MTFTYCERTGPGLCDEPLNAVTNAAFLVAAWAVWRLARRRHALHADIWVLIGLLVTIGIGSGLFHTFATEWSRWLDVIPILLFQLFCTWLYARKVMGAGALGGTGILAAYLGTGALTSLLPQAALNGSLQYAPAWLFLLLLGIYHRASGKPERWLMLSAAGTFSLSLFFRTIDVRMVGAFPPGTHFLWHLLNGLTLYLAARALLPGRDCGPQKCGQQH